MTATEPAWTLTVDAHLTHSDGTTDTIRLVGTDQRRSRLLSQALRLLNGRWNDLGSQLASDLGYSGSSQMKLDVTRDDADGR